MKLVHFITEMAAKKLCDKCGKSMAANHYWYKGGWKCKAVKPAASATTVTLPLASNGGHTSVEYDREAERRSDLHHEFLRQQRIANLPKSAADLKVGDSVGFKYDVEQFGPIVKISRDAYGPVFTVRATQGGYAEEAGGEAYPDFRFDELWFD